MKKKEKNSTRAFALRIALALALTSISAILLASSLRPPAAGPQPDRQTPDVVAIFGPVSQDRDLRLLPYQPPNSEQEEVRLTRHPLPEGAHATHQPALDPGQQLTQKLMHGVLLATPTMPGPVFTFAGMTQNLGCGGCIPPDTDGDVGPNHYVQSVNSSIRIHDKIGNVLAGPITYNAFFSALGNTTPCGNNQNQGDGIVFYDHMADRWVVSDFAFPAFPGTSFWQCIGVSKTSDPVAGGWYLYTVQVDPANTNYLGDYPKFGLWPDAYYLSMNEFSTNTTFNGVRVYALDRNSMINGGSANAIGFSILPVDLGDQYSLVPASFRTGDPPPAGQPEWLLSVNSSAAAGTVETQVFVRRFHVDFVTPANSTFGVGATHAPDGIITVNGFKDAFNFAFSTNLCPNGTVTTTQWLDTLGDKIMYPMIYQNRGGQEFLYADQTILLATDVTLTGPTAVRWYQIDVTGNAIPAAPTQQQDWNNGGDGLFRWMPSINVDWQGNVAIGYSASSTTVDPGIRWAGRLATDPLNNMSQGESVMTPGTGHQTSTNGRWGDYSTMFVDPNNSCTFYHTNEYFTAIAGSAWNTRVGTFRFGCCTDVPVPSGTPSPTPTASPVATATPTPTSTATATPALTPTPSPTPPVSAGPVTVVATAGTLGPTDYATVQLAFAAINSGTHQGDIQVWVMADTVEAASAVLNASGGGGASYTSVLMLPNGTRTVSGNLAAPLIDLNGAKNVRIDGYNSMTLSNTSTIGLAGTSTVRFINGAQNDTVANCNIQGSSTVALGTAGGTIVFSTTTGTGVNSGNSNNIVANNSIGPAGGFLPNKAIFGLGTTTSNNTQNRSNVINNNNIFDFFNMTSSVSGIHILSGNTDWTISNNRIYQTAFRIFGAAALRYAGITLNSTAGTLGWFTVTNNVIGFGAANGTGTTSLDGADNEFRGIDAASVNIAGNGTATRIQGNVISGIDQTTSRNSTSITAAGFIGIALGTGTNGAFDVLGNQIGSIDVSSNVFINATSTTAGTSPEIMILDFSTRSNQINGNQIGNIVISSGGTGTTVGFRGILINTAAASVGTANNNIISNINDFIAGSYAMYGIQTSLCAASITGNTIQYMTGNSNGAGLVIGAGLAINAGSSTASASTISRNTIYSLTNASGAATNSIYAIDLTLATSANVTGNLVERNFIHSLSMTASAGSQLWGIVMRGQGRSTFQNNMIRLGIDDAGNSIMSPLSIIGIRDIAGATASYYYNSVYIGGTGVVSLVNTFAFFSDVVTNVRNFKDNIFWNARSNGSGSSANIAIAVGGTAPNPAGLTSNYNDLYATGVGGAVGLFNGVVQNTLSDWQTATGQDANSISANPLFVDPTGNLVTVNLHIMTGSPAIGAATPIPSTLANPLNGIRNDFDGDVRNTTTPDIGADERTNFVPTLSISKTADADPVVAGDQIGFTVTLTNGTAGTATTLNVNDNLPAGTDVNWTIDAGNTSLGWSVTGSPPNQSLSYSFTSLPGNSSTTAHVVSTTTGNSVGAYNNTARFSADTGCVNCSASASLTVVAPSPTPTATATFTPTATATATFTPTATATATFTPTATATATDTPTPTATATATATDTPTPTATATATATPTPTATATGGTPTPTPTCTPGVTLYGISNGIGTAANNQIYQINPTTGTISNAHQVTLAGFTVSKSNALAARPGDGVLFGVIETTDALRRLVTINPNTGVATAIGALTNKISSLAFRNTGTLWAVSGDDGSPADTLYTVNTSNAALTIQFALGNGDFGEAIAFHGNGLMYHSSGDASAMFESVNVDTQVVTPIGTAVGEMFAMGYNPANAQLYGSDINSNLFTINIASGARTPIGFINGPSTNRGLAFVSSACPSPTPTPTAIATSTPTATATSTPTATATFTPTATATATAIATATATATSTPTPTPTPTATVSQITVDGTKCDKFSSGTATTLGIVTYKVDNHGKTKEVKPPKFMYWVKVTAVAGNNTFVIDQLITTGNFNTQFKLDGGGNVFKGSDCKPAMGVHMTQNTTNGANSTVTVTFKAQQAGVYYIAVKFQTGNVNGDPAPAPSTTVHYDFSTTGVPGSTSSVDLVKQ